MTLWRSWPATPRRKHKNKNKTQKSPWHGNRESKLRSDRTSSHLHCASDGLPCCEIQQNFLRASRNCLSSDITVEPLNDLSIAFPDDGTATKNLRSLTSA